MTSWGGENDGNFDQASQCHYLGRLNTSSSLETFLERDSSFLRHNCERGSSGSGIRFWVSADGSAFGVSFRSHVTCTHRQLLYLLIRLGCFVVMPTVSTRLRPSTPARPAILSPTFCSRFQKTSIQPRMRRQVQHIKS
jgi:hypothetical protein